MLNDHCSIPASSSLVSVLPIVVGYLATTADEYASCLAAALDKYQRDMGGVNRLRERAREAAKRFSDEAFEVGAVQEFAEVLL